LCATGGGYTFRPNFHYSAEIVLRDFRAGLLGHFNLDIDLLKNDCGLNTMHDPNVPVGIEVS